VSNSSLFDAYYYEHGCGRPYERDEDWLNFFDGIAKRIIEESKPKTVLDAGCALVFLVEAFRNHGVEAFGVDISKFAIENVYPDIKPYCWVGSVCEPFPQKYDLITGSKAWKLVTAIRKIRVWLLPRDSHRERLVKKVWHGMKKSGKWNTL
jgi:SAM-dependent methyltransferase